MFAKHGEMGENLQAVAAADVIRRDKERQKKQMAGGESDRRNRKVS